VDQYCIWVTGEHIGIVGRIVLIGTHVKPMSADTSGPRCGGPIVFVEESTKAFGWRYRCGRGRQRISRQEARKRHSTSTVRCSGYVSATTNTWFAGCRHLYRSLSLLFCWLAWLPVTVSSDAAQCDRLLTTTAWPERCAK